MPDLARELAGDLPCIGCGYNLKSQSIRGVCPECATPVRATLLARIDPLAGVLRPITYPTLTAMGLMVWSLAALAAGLLTWSLRVVDAWAMVVDAQAASPRPVVMAATVCIVLCGLGGLVLVRPHAGIAVRQQIAALVGVLGVWGFAVVYWRLHAGFDPVHVRPYFQNDAVLQLRHMLRLLAAGFLAIALLGLRPNVRMLAARSLVMRMGRVDRQTMIAMVAALLVAALGDVLHLIAMQTYGVTFGILRTAGTAMIALGSMLLTVGLFGIVIDALRLVPVILRPALSMAHLLGTDKDDEP